MTDADQIPTDKKPASPVSKAAKLLLKILITLLCFWYISRKIDWQLATNALARAHAGWLVLAVLLYLVSKVLSALRLNIYFRNIGLRLSEKTNLRLYWMGMFYNLFLPGAISGDAYKVLLLHRRYGTPYKPASAAVLLDRFSGLLALGLLLAGYGLVVLPQTLWQVAFVAGGLAGGASLYLIIRIFFPVFVASFWPAFFWGLLVQGVQVGCVYALVAAIGQPLLPVWIFISLLATVVSVLPLSLGGGLGTRELVFAEAAIFFGLDPAVAVAISLLFYGCNLITSLWGVYFVFRDPLME